MLVIKKLEARPDELDVSLVTTTADEGHAPDVLLVETTTDQLSIEQAVVGRSFNVSFQINHG